MCCYVAMCLKEKNYVLLCGYLFKGTPQYKRQKADVSQRNIGFLLKILSSPLPYNLTKRPVETECSGVITRIT